MKSIGVRVVLLWNSTPSECVKRIQSRGLSHRSIRPSDNIGQIVFGTNQAYEPLGTEEINRYSISKVIEIRDAVCMTRETVIRQILQGLAEFDERLRDVSDETIRAAVEATQAREISLGERSS